MLITTLWEMKSEIKEYRSFFCNYEVSVIIMVNTTAQVIWKMEMKGEIYQLTPGNETLGSIVCDKRKVSHWITSKFQREDSLPANTVLSKI